MTKNDESRGNASERQSFDLSPLIADARAEQRRAIVSLSPLIVVSAGAGTGKTHTLARRFAWLLASDPTCRVERILTLTFTQLAASEMRERIRATLTEWYNRYPKELSHLRDAIARIDEAYISTIHAFALRVLRESGLELDVDPGASLASEPMERTFWAEFAWNLRTLSTDRICAGLPDEWRARAREMMGDPAFMPFLNFFDAQLLAGLARAAGEVFGSMNGTPEEFLHFDETCADNVRLVVASRASPMWRAVWNKWQSEVMPGLAEDLARAKDGKFVSVLRGFWAEWHGVAHNEKCERDFFVAVIDIALGDLRGGGKVKESLADLLGEELKVWRDAHRPLAEITKALFCGDGYGENERAVRRMLLGVAALGWQAWARARAAGGMLSFADLVRYAGRVMAGNERYAARFRHVMVDEFQDTDGLQDEMVRALVAESRTLFIVGDIKQSIYRFRHANPMLFADYIRRAECLKSSATGENIPLSHSYRMSGRMMDCVNEVFGAVWCDGVVTTGDDMPPVRYEPLRKPDDAAWWSVRNGEDAPSRPCSILLYLPEEGGKTKVGESRKKLAIAIAQKISQMRNEGALVWDKDKESQAGERGENQGEKGKKGAFRPLAWRDVTILVATRTPYPVIEEAFEEQGVPVLFGRSMDYFNRGEVQDMVNLLRLLDAPDDAYALAGWLESPYSGVPPESGLRYVADALSEGGRVGDLRARFERAHPAAYARLERLRRTALLYGPTEALLLLLQDTFWLAAYRAPVRARVMANVRRGVDMVREYESSMGTNLSACADYLGRAMRVGAAAEEPDMSGGDADAVRVMTIHASKGLEFPFVVLMGVENPKKWRSRGKAEISRNIGVTVGKIPDLTGSGEPQPSVTAKWHAFMENLEEGEEYERLMYVAMTRAQEYLLCAGVANDASGHAPQGGWLETLLNLQARAGFWVDSVDDRTIEAFKNEKMQEFQGTDEAEDFFHSAPPTLPARLATPAKLVKFSGSAYSLLKWCPAAYRMRYRQGRELKWEMPDGDGYGGADMGSLAHWVLARWDLRRDTLAALLPPEASRAALETALRALPPYLRAVYARQSIRSTLFEWLALFADSESGRSLAELKERSSLQHETAFSVPLERDIRGTNLVGSIDLYWRDAAGQHVRDWKITPARTAPEELYDEQVNFYALVCHLIEPDCAIDAGLIHLRPGEAATAPRRIDDWATLHRSVSEAAEIAVSGPFERAAEKCPRCPFRRFCS